jgi:hypothetical protein
MSKPISLPSAAVDLAWATSSEREAIDAISHVRLGDNVARATNGHFAVEVPIAYDGPPIYIPRSLCELARKVFPHSDLDLRYEHGTVHLSHQHGPVISAQAGDPEMKYPDFAQVFLWRGETPPDESARVAIDPGYVRDFIDFAARHGQREVVLTIFQDAEPLRVQIGANIEAVLMPRRQR